MSSAKAKQPTKAKQRLCGAKLKKPNRKGSLTCERTAGAGTPHKGRGPCSKHTGSTPNVVKRYAREEAVAQARHFLDDENLEIEPTDAALFNVRVAHMIVRFQRAKIAALDVVTPDDLLELDRGLRTAQHVTDVALKADIAERVVNIAERAGETLALICEDGLAALIKAGLKITPAQRTLYAQAIESAAQRYEDGTPELPLKAVA